MTDSGLWFEFCAAIARLRVENFSKVGVTSGYDQMVSIIPDCFSIILLSSSVTHQPQCCIVRIHAHTRTTPSSRRRHHCTHAHSQELFHHHDLCAPSQYVTHVSKHTHTIVNSSTFSRCSTAAPTDCAAGPISVCICVFLRSGACMLCVVSMLAVVIVYCVRRGTCGNIIELSFVAYLSDWA